MGAVRHQPLRYALAPVSQHDRRDQQRSQRRGDEQDIEPQSGSRGGDPLARVDQQVELPAGQVDRQVRVDQWDGGPPVRLASIEPKWFQPCGPELPPIERMIAARGEFGTSLAEAATHHCW